MFWPMVPPDAVEDRRAPGEVHAGELRTREDRVGDRRGIAGQKVDHARRKPRLLEQPHDVVRAEHRAARRLPHDGVAHQRGGRRQVAADRGEVERRHRIHESLERAIVELVPHRLVAERLLVVQLLRVMRVEAPEIHQLARGIDLRLVRRLRLAEHRRGVDRRSPRRGEQLRRLQQHRGAILPRPVGPLSPGRTRGRDRHLRVLRRRLVVVGQHVLVRVRHHRVAEVAGANFLASDDDRNLDALRGHLRQARFELRSFGRSRRVRANGLVHRFGNAAIAAEAGEPRGRRGNGSCRSSRTRRRLLARGGLGFGRMGHWC